MDRDEFFNEALKPGFPDTMDFAIARDDDLGLSVDAFNTMGHQMHDYVLARAVGFNHRTGSLPNALRVRVTVEYDAPPQSELERGSVPWWSLDDVGGVPLLIDGTLRMDALFNLAKEEDD